MTVAEAVEPAYAPWWRRGVAYLVDAVLIGIPIFAVAAIAGAGGNDGSLTLIFVLGYGLPLAYFTYFHGSERGQTPGKMLTGVRVRTDGGGERLSYGRAFARYLIVVVLGWFVLPVILDFLWPLWDRKNQALHDKVAGSVVLRA